MSTRRIRRSVLFVPAIRPDRFEKAVATGVDAVCLDLEDGVPFGQKDEARDKAMALLAERPPCRAEVILRVNEPASRVARLESKKLIYCIFLFRRQCIPPISLDVRRCTVLCEADRFAALLALRRDETGMATRPDLAIFSKLSASSKSWLCHWDVLNDLRVLSIPVLRSKGVPCLLRCPPQRHRGGPPNSKKNSCLVLLVSF